MAAARAGPGARAGGESKVYRWWRRGCRPGGARWRAPRSVRAIEYAGKLPLRPDETRSGPRWLAKKRIPCMVALLIEIQASDSPAAAQWAGAKAEREHAVREKEALPYVAAEIPLC